MSDDLDDVERQMLRFNVTPLVPMERLELLDFLGYPDPMPPPGLERLEATVAEILRRRGCPGGREALERTWDAGREVGWRECADATDGKAYAEEPNPYRTPTEETR